MESTDILITVGPWALVMIAVLGFTYLEKSRYAGILERVADNLTGEVEEILAPYGDKLEGVNMAAAFVQSLIDDDGDLLAKAIPGDLRAALLKTLTALEDVTDGEVEPESIGDAEAVPQAEQS